jgi:hypothetical protein
MPAFPERRRPRLLAGTLGAAVAVAGCLALAGCATGPPPPVGAQELSYAETFPYFKLYWVGREFDGRPLTAVDGLASYEPDSGESVYYGGCEPHGGLLGEGACQLPLRITSVIYVPHSNGVLGPQSNRLLRGVPAVLYDHGRSIELYSGHLAIDVSAAKPADALLAVRLLRPLNAPGAPGEPLPPPTYCPGLVGAVAGHLARVLAALPDRACQRRAAEEAEAEGPAEAAPRRGGPQGRSRRGSAARR